MAKYHIFTDGSSRGNPGKGGWGMVVMNEDETKIFYTDSNFEDNVTNNRMELKAMICALGYAESNPDDKFVIYSDSAYVVNSCNSWLRTWSANGWKNSKKQIVENVDLMKAIWDYISRPFFNVEVCKCKGHEGDTGNELADAIATGDMLKFKTILEFWEVTIEGAGDNWFPID